MRKTELYRVMPWVGGINTSVDPGVLNSQELVQADNVKFSASGARIKREAFEYLDNEVFPPDLRSSSGTTRTLTWNSHPLVNIITPDARLVKDEIINVTGDVNYDASEVVVTSTTQIEEETSIICVADISGSLAGKYFLISQGDLGTDYYVWFKVSGVGTDPEVTSRTGIEVDISTNASATTVRNSVSTALGALSSIFSVSNVSSAEVDVTHLNGGYTTDAAAGTSGFTIAFITQGGTSITYEAQNSFSESTTSAGSVVVARASSVIWVEDYWRFDGSEKSQLLVYVTDTFQMFKLDNSGRRVQIFGQEQQTQVTTLAASSITTGHYFLVNGPNNLTNYYVWYNKDSAGGDPMIGGRTGIGVAISSGDSSALVASETANRITTVASGNISATSLSNVVTITNSTAGITDNSVDGNTTFTITTTKYGATLPVAKLDTVRMLTFNERLFIFFSGMGNFPVKYMPEEDTKYQLVVPNLPSVGIQMPDASFAFTHLSRIWANDKSNPDEIHYSETFDETLWLGLGDSGAIPVYPGDGDPEGFVNGYSYKGSMVVLAKKNSRFRIDGDSPENFIVTQISQGLGNEGAMAIPVDETDVVFLSRRGVHSQGTTDQYGDVAASYLSAKIKPTFNAFDPETLHKVQGTYIPELNSMALAFTEQGLQSAQDIWLFNFEIQVPNNDQPGAWYRWPGISCTALNRRLVNSQHKLITGTSYGRVTQAQKANSFTDFGDTGILFNIKTGTIYPGNDPQSMKMFKKITMIYRPKGNFSFAVNAKIDNHLQQGFAFNEISGLDLLGETFILGTSLLGSSNTLAPFTLSMDGHGRGVTLTVMQPTANEQIEIWGFAIEYEIADLEQEVQ